jgi:hypothetical protein
MARFTLFYRPRPGRPWQPVASAPTHAGVIAAIGTGGRPHGDWYATTAATTAATTRGAGA